MPDHIHTILFVCSGNTCRSPLALAAWRAFGLPLLARDVQDKNTAPRWRAASAGLSASDGAPVSPAAIEVARGWNVNLSTHHARRLTADMTRRASLICTMTPEQAEQVRNRYPVIEDKVRLLGSYAPETAAVSTPGAVRLQKSSLMADEWQATILDPFGGSREAYETCAAQIRRAVEGLARTLRLETQE